MTVKTYCFPRKIRNPRRFRFCFQNSRWVTVPKWRCQTQIFSLWKIQNSPFPLTYISIFKLCLLCFFLVDIWMTLWMGYLSFVGLSSPLFGFSKSFSLGHWPINLGEYLCGQDGFDRDALTRRFIQLNEYGWSHKSTDRNDPLFGVFILILVLSFRLDGHFGTKSTKTKVLFRFCAV